MKKQVTEKIDPLKPSANVLIALGSLFVHIEELLETPSPFKGKTLADEIEGLAPSATFDLAAIRQGLNDTTVRAWITEMDKMAFLPKKRH